jgi:hypothetical protein
MRSKPILFVTALVIVFCCGLGGCSSSTGDKGAGDSTKLFLSLFAEISPAGLHVYSPSETLPADKFSGTRIDTSFYRLMKLKDQNDWQFTDTSNHFYASYRFCISDEQTGLLIRRPSQYSESAVDLYVWNNVSNQVEQIENLSDGFGDEGWFFLQDAWLEDANKDNRVDFITRRKDFDRNLDDTTKIHRSDSLFVYLHSRNRFMRSASSVDTQKYQIKYWEER